MPLIWMFFAVLISAAVLLNSNQTHQQQARHDAEISAMSGSMLVYRNFVAVFSDANPAFVGSASDALLNIPDWYKRPGALSNYIGAGKSYVFYSALLPGLAGELASKTQSTAVGTNLGGFLNSPNTGNTGIALPSVIPVSAVVILQ